LLFGWIKQYTRWLPIRSSRRWACWYRYLLTEKGRKAALLRGAVDTVAAARVEGLVAHRLNGQQWQGRNGGNRQTQRLGKKFVQAKVYMVFGSGVALIGHLTNVGNLPAIAILHAHGTDAHQLTLQVGKLAGILCGEKGRYQQEGDMVSPIDHWYQRYQFFITIPIIPTLLIQ
jgi:hypothetical protein